MMITAMTSAWKTKAARQLIAEVLRPPISGPAAAPTPPIALIALQAVLLVSRLAHFGDAVAVNVIYGLRGIWSVLAVGLVGHWFANRETLIGQEAMRSRLVGAALLSAAVVLVFV